MPLGSAHFVSLISCHAPAHCLMWHFAQFPLLARLVFFFFFGYGKVGAVRKILAYFIYGPALGHATAGGNVECCHLPLAEHNFLLFCICFMRRLILWQTPWRCCRAQAAALAACHLPLATCHLPLATCHPPLDKQLISARKMFEALIATLSRSPKHGQPAANTA